MLDVAGLVPGASEGRVINSKIFNLFILFIINDYF